MLRKYLSFALAIILLQITAGSAFSSTKAEKDAARLANVKAEVANRGTGKKAQIRVKMLDGRTLKGFIKESGSDDFVLQESNGSFARAIAYVDVSKIQGKEVPKYQKFFFWWGVLTVAAYFASGRNS